MEDEPADLMKGLVGKEDDFIVEDFKEQFVGVYDLILEALDRSGEIEIEIKSLTGGKTENVTSNGVYFESTRGKNSGEAEEGMLLGVLIFKATETIDGPIYTIAINEFVDERDTLTHLRDRYVYHVWPNGVVESYGTNVLITAEPEEFESKGAVLVRRKSDNCVRLLYDPRTVDAEPNIRCAEYKEGLNAVPLEALLEQYGYLDELASYLEDLTYDDQRLPRDYLYDSH